MVAGKIKTREEFDFSSHGGAVDACEEPMKNNQEGKIQFLL
jgi:hypothetical protein